MATRSVSSSRVFASINLNKCCNFAASNSQITFTAPTSFNPANLTTFTFAVWLKFRSYAGAFGGGSERIFEGAVSNNSPIWIVPGNAGLDIRVPSGTGNFGQAIIDNGYVPKDRWCRLLVTWNDASNTYPTVYINGISITPKTTQAFTGSRSNCSGSTMYIGNNGGGARPFDGLMDELCLWNRVLTSTEITQDYTQGLQPVSTNGLILRYAMDEASGNLTDSSSSGLTGTPTGITQNVTSLSYSRSTAGSRFLSYPTEKALSFNGTSDKVSIPIVPSTTGFNLSMWMMKKGSFAAQEFILDCTDAATKNGFRFVHDAGSSGFYCLVSNASSIAYSGPNKKTNVGIWDNYTITYNGSNLKLYINTVLQATGTGSMTTPARQFYMCVDAGGSTIFSNVVIKDFIFQNTTTPWTQAQINALYYQRQIPTGANVWYKFDNNVNDSTGNGNTGTLTGGTYTTNVPSQFTARSLT